jgi:hypothetical protein
VVAVVCLEIRQEPDQLVDPVLTLCVLLDDLVEARPFGAKLFQ